MNSQQIQSELETAQARQTQITSELGVAKDALKKADLEFIDNKITMEELTSFQSSATALERALAAIEGRIAQLTTEHQQAIKDEALEAFADEIAQIETEKAKVAEQFRKQAAKASKAFAEIVGGLNEIMQSHAALASRAKDARRRLAMTDKEGAEKIVEQRGGVFDPEINRWMEGFTGDLSPLLLQAVAGSARRRPIAPAQQVQEQSEVERRLSTHPNESEVARRLAQPVGSSEVASRLGRN